MSVKERIKMFTNNGDNSNTNNKKTTSNDNKLLQKNSISDEDSNKMLREQLNNLASIFINSSREVDNNILGIFYSSKIRIDLTDIEHMNIFLYHCKSRRSPTSTIFQIKNPKILFKTFVEMLKIVDDNYIDEIIKYTISHMNNNGSPTQLFTFILSILNCDNKIKMESYLNILNKNLGDPDILKQEILVEIAIHLRLDKVLRKLLRNCKPSMLIPKDRREPNDYQGWRPIYIFDYIYRQEFLYSNTLKTLFESCKTDPAFMNAVGYVFDNMYESGRFEGSWAGNINIVKHYAYLFMELDVLKYFNIRNDITNKIITKAKKTYSEKKMKYGKEYPVIIKKVMGDKIGNIITKYMLPYDILLP